MHIISCNNILVNNFHAFWLLRFLEEIQHIDVLCVAKQFKGDMYGHNTDHYDFNNMLRSLYLQLYRIIELPMVTWSS